MGYLAEYVLSNYFTTLGLVKESYKLSMKRIRYELSLDYENEVERMLSMIDIENIKKVLQSTGKSPLK